MHGVEQAGAQGVQGQEAGVGAPWPRQPGEGAWALPAQATGDN